MIDDTDEEPAETFKLMLERGPGLDPAISVDTDAKVVTIAKNDVPPTEVASDWALVPSGLNVGDEFRLLVITSTERNADSTTIAHYDTHVQNAVKAGHTAIRSHSSLFQVVGCTAAVDARDHTYTTHTATAPGVAIYWLDGNKAADDYGDFYDGDWDEEATGKNESGTDVSFPVNLSEHPFTGCDHDGTEEFSGSTSRALGATLVRQGDPNGGGSAIGPIDGNRTNGTTVTGPFYGLSPVFRVVAANNPPSFTSGATFSVVENTTEVGTVEAEDTDTGDAITGYSIDATTGGADRAQFEITDEGVLTFKTAPDYENPADVESTNPANDDGNNEYIVTVTATGGTGDRAMTATQTITVTVTDVRPPPAPVTTDEEIHTFTSLSPTWNELADTPSVTGYDIRYRPQVPANSPWTTLTDVATTAVPASGSLPARRQATITGLLPSSSYDVQVRAKSVEGEGAWSANFGGGPGLATQENEVYFDAASYDVVEGGSVEVTVRLAAAHGRATGNFRLAVIGLPGQPLQGGLFDLTLPSPFSFSATETEKTVTVAGDEDALVEAEETFELVFPDLLLPSGITYGSPAKTRVSIKDAVTITPRALTVTEENATGGAYTVVLNRPPAASATVTISGHSGTDVRVNGAASDQTLTFTTANYGTAQTVTVTAVDDADATDDAVTLSHAVSGLGATTAAGDVAVTVTDNDEPPPTLSGLTVSAGTLSLAFAADKLEYAVTGIAHATERITINATPESGVTVSFLDADDMALEDADDATDGHQVDLDVGRNTVKIRVTKGTDTQTYTVTITRRAASTDIPVTVVWNAAAKSMTVDWSDAETCAAPSRYVIYYAFSGIAVKLGDVAATETSYSKTIATGATDFTIKVYCGNVTAQPDGRLVGEALVDKDRTDTYPSSNADLSRLELSGITLAFDPADTTYGPVVAASGVDSVTITAAAQQKFAQVAIATTPTSTDADPNADGYQLTLADGTTYAIAVTVTAQDGTDKTYTVNLRKRAAAPPASDASLASLRLSRLFFTQPFNSDQLIYGSLGSFGLSSTTVTAVPTDPLATVRVALLNQRPDPLLSLPINFPDSVPAAADGTVQLTVGNNAVAVEVTAQDLVTKRVYVVIVYLSSLTAPPGPGPLDSLTVSPGRINGFRGSDRLEYAVGVGPEVETITVTPTLDPPQTYIAIAGELGSSSVGHDVSLDPGLNVIWVVVGSRPSLNFKLYVGRGVTDAFGWKATDDFDTLDAAGNSYPRYIWSDGRTTWVSDWHSTKNDAVIYAYDTTTKARKPGEDFSAAALRAAGNTRPMGLWSDGSTIWVADDRSGHERLVAYDLETKARKPGEDFNTLRAAGNHSIRGIWSDGTTMWVADYSDGKIYAYDLATKARKPGEDFNTLRGASVTSPRGIWSDGATMWVVSGSTRKIHAFDLATKARDAAKDFNNLGAPLTITEAYVTTSYSVPLGIWSDGDTMWVANAALPGPSLTKLVSYNMPASANGYLSSLELSGITLAPEFASRTLAYKVRAPHSLTSTTVTAAAAHAGASSPVIKLNGVVDPDGTMSLAVGSNAITVEVTAEDGTTTTYTVTVTRASATAASVATLSGLTLSGLTLSPAFSGGVTSGYTATALHSVSSTTVTPTLTDANAGYVIRLGGAARSVDAAADVPLAVGANVITVVVTAEDASTTRTYTATVTRQGSSDASLSALELSGLTLSPAFSSGVATGYTATVPHSLSSTTVTPTLGEINASYVIKLGGTVDADGTVPLAAGANVITVEVTAEDGVTTQTYEATVTREPSTDAALSALAVSPVDIVGFRPDAVDYAVGVAGTVSQVTITATSAETNASIAVAGQTTASGLGRAVTLADGLNNIQVVVTAQDGVTTMTYTIHVGKGVTDAYGWKASDDLNGLNALRVNDPQGLWSDGTRVWVADNVDDKVYAYDLATGAQRFDDTFHSLDGFNHEATGLWSDGETMWVGQGRVYPRLSYGNIYAYDLATKSRVEARDFTGVGYNASTLRGLASDGEIMWIADSSVPLVGPQFSSLTPPVYANLRAYYLNSKAEVRSARIPLHLSGVVDGALVDFYHVAQPAGVWTDGATIWVSDQEDGKIYAFDAWTKLRRSSRDFNTLSAAGNRRPAGIWSDGVTMWVANNGDASGDKVFSYNLPPSNNADLRSLTVDGVSVPGFKTDRASIGVRLNYDLRVDNTVRQVTVAATAKQRFVQGVEILPIDADPLAEGHQVDLSVGDNPVTVTVTAQDGTTTKKYTLTVTRAKPTVSIAADAATAAEGGSLTFTVTRDPAAAYDLEVTVNVSETGGDAIAASGEGDRTVTIAANDASAALTVTTESDDAWEEHSTVTAAIAADAAYDIAAPPDDAASTEVQDDDFPEATAELAVDPANLVEGGTVTATLTITTARDEEPHGDPGTATFTTADGSAAAPADYTALSSTQDVAAGDFTRVDIDDTGAEDFRWRATKTANVATQDDSIIENEETFTVSAALPSGITAAGAQTVTITDNDGMLPTLTSLSVSEGTLTPPFAAGTLEYSVPNIPNATERITVTAVAAGGITVAFLQADGTTALADADAIASGHQVDLDVGPNTVKIRVTRGTDTQTYTLIAVRQAPFNTVTVTLTPGPGTLRFDVSWEDAGICSSLTQYHAELFFQGVHQLSLGSVASTENSLTFTNTALIITGDRVEVWCGPRGTGRKVGEVAIVLPVGTFHSPARDATLSSLTVSPVDISSFAADTTEYEVEVANSVTSVTITPETSDANASVTYLDADDVTLEDADDMTDGYQVTLEEGENVIKVKVAAADIRFTQTYTVTVARARSDTSISGVTFTNNVALRGTVREGRTRYAARYAGAAALPQTTTVTVELPEVGSTVEITVPVDDDRKPNGHQVVLTDRRTLIEFTVTAEDGSTTQSYVVVVGVDSDEPGQWNVERDIDTLVPENDKPNGVTGDATYLWVLENEPLIGNNVLTGYVNDHIYAYRRSDGARVAAEDFAGLTRADGGSTIYGAAQGNGQGLWSDGDRMNVVGDNPTAGNDSVFYLRFNNRGATPGESHIIEPREFSGNRVGHQSRGIWQNGATMWVLDQRYPTSATTSERRVLAFTGYDARDESREIVLSGLDDVRGITGDGIIMWVANDGDANTEKLWAYRIADKSRAPSQDIAVHSEVGDTDVTDIWSDNATMFALDKHDGKVFSFNMPKSARAALSGLTVSAGGDDLDLGKAFSATDYTGYAASVEFSINQAVLTPVVDQSQARYVDSGGGATCKLTVTPPGGTASERDCVMTAGVAGALTVDLEVGNTAIVVEVAAEDDVFKQTYTATVTRQEAPVLTGLTVSPGTLTPTFASGTTAYSVPGLAYGSNRITVTATPESGAAVSFLDGADATLPDADGGASGHQVDLDPGSNTVKVRVTKGTETQDYTLVITRAKPTVSIAAVAATATEGASLSFTVTRTPAAGDALEVAVNVSESGSLVAAAQEGEKTVTIAANGTTATLAVAAEADDTTWEEHSTVTAAITANAAYTVAAAPNNAATTQVRDDDFPAATAALTADPASVAEGRTVTATLTITTARDEQPHKDAGTVTFSTADGTATAPADYTALSSPQDVAAGDFSRVDIDDSPTEDFRWRAAKTAQITTVSDTASEGSETFTVSAALSAGITAPSARTVTIIEIPELTNLTVSPGTLMPAFAADTLEYAVTGIAHATERLTVTATPGSGATVAFLQADGTTALDDADTLTSGHQVDLDVGPNTVKIRATRGADTRTYTLIAVRQAQFNTVTVTLTLTPALRFDVSWEDAGICPSPTEYHAELFFHQLHKLSMGSVASTESSLTFTNTAPLLIVNRVEVWCGERGTGRKVGEVGIFGNVGTFHSPARDATLSALSVSPVDISNFAADTTEYELEVESSIIWVTITSETSDSGASVAFLNADDMTLEDAHDMTDGFQVLLKDGENVIKLKVSAADTRFTQTYTVTVTRATNSVSVDWNATNKSMSVSWSDGSTCSSPTKYFIYLSSGGVDVKLGDVAATVAAFDKTVSTIVADFTIKVYCGDATATPAGRLVGEVMVDYDTTGAYPPSEDPASTDATLSALTVSEGTLHGFPDSRPFVVGVANSVTSIDVTATVSDSGATITVNTNAATSGIAHTVSSLAVGRNTVTVLVTAEDTTTTETYTIHVERGVTTDYGWKASDDLNGLYAAGNTTASGLWSNETTMWVADIQDDNLYAYALSDGTRQTVLDIDPPAGNDNPQGIWSDDNTVWVADWDDRKLYAYALSGGARQANLEFNLHADNIAPGGIWSNGTTMWVADVLDRKLYAYALSGGARQTSLDFSLHADNDAPRDIWSDGVTLWVSDSGTDKKLYAYKLTPGADFGTRDSGRDFNTMDAAGNDDPYGIWSDGVTMWVVNDGANELDKVFSYNMPPPGLGIADASAEEGEAITFTVTLGLGASGTVTVQYATSGGTATEGTDYTAASGTLTFNAGEKTKTITVQTTDDTTSEGDETFTVTLSNPTGDASISDATATGTISDANKAPTFTSSAAFSVAENQTAVGTVTAVDADSEDSITGYSLTGGADMATFMITPKGVLIFVTAPDHANPTDLAGNNEYIVEVTAASGTGDRAMTAVQTITVTVTAPVELVSNDGQPTHATHRPPVGANEVAQGFTTGANSGGYTLSNIQVRTWSGPTGSDTLTVTLNDDNSGEPGDVVATLENPATVENGLMTYTAPANTTLAARTTYYVVFSYSADTGGPALHSPTTNHEDSGSVPPWSIGDDRHERDRTPVGAWSTDPFGLEIKVNGGLAPDTTAPVLQKRELIDTTTLTLTYDETLKDSVPPGSAYTVYVGAAETQQTPTNVAVSGPTVTLTLGTAVTAGETVTLSYTAPTGAGAMPVEDEAGNDAANFAKQTVLNPASRPTISSVAVTSTAPAFGVYSRGDEIEVTVTFSEAVTVDTTLGTPYLKLQMASLARVNAEFDRGSGTTALVFAYTVGQADYSGRIAGQLVGFLINANELELGGGTIESTANAGVSATLTYAEVPRSPDHRVAARIRSIEIMNTPAGGVYGLGDIIEVRVTFTNRLTFQNQSPSEVKLQVGQNERRAGYHSFTQFSGGNHALFDYRYRVAAGDEDADGISLPADAFERNSAEIYGGPSAGAQQRPAFLRSNAIGPLADRRVDGVLPVLETAVVAESTLTLTYSEALDDTSTPPATAYTLAVTSGTAPTVSNVAVSGRAVTLTLSRVVASTETLTLDYTAPTGVGATPVQDLARNDAANLDNESVTVTDTPQPTITLVASTSGAEDFKLLISFGEAVTGFEKSEITLNDAWLIEATATLTADPNTPGNYSVPIFPSPNVAGLTVPLNVTIAAAAAQDKAAPTPNDSLEGTLALEAVYTGPATFISQVDPADADGDFDIEVYFLDGQISGRPVTGFEADDIAVTNGSVTAFTKEAPRYQKDDGAHQGGDDFLGPFTGHLRFSATITPDAGCGTPCTVTVDVARGAATSADITQDYWAHIHSGWTAGDPVDEGHTPRPNFKANTLTVQREATGTNLYVRALALYRDPNNFAYRASFLMNEENQTLRKTHFAADNATLELIGDDEPRLLWEFWAEVAADGNVVLKVDTDRDGDYDADDYTYTITDAKKTLPAPKTVRAARSADGGKTAKSRTAEAAQAVEIPDAALRSILEALLGKQAGDALTTADLATVVSLNLRDSGVAALGGLQHAVNLTDLYLEDFSLDLAPLQGLGLFVHVPGEEPLRLPSTDATLSGLTLSGVNIGAFDPATSDYTAGVGNDVTETTVTATANDGGAAYVIKLGGVEDADGVIPLAVGANVISIEVTAEDGQTTKTYTVTATRAEASPSSDATLSSLELSGITFDFDPATYSYDLSVGNEVTETAITVETNDEGASYEIALMISDGYSNGTMTLAEGYNFIWLLVTAEDGETTANYTVTVTRAASSSADAALSALTLSGLNIGTFDPATTDYTASVGNDVTETAVTATANDEGATYVIKLDGAADADGTVELAVGANVITVEVTAEDGQTTNIYTVTVNRAGTPLTAEFQEAPESHNGTDAFTFRIAFSEPISTSYVVVRDHALEVTGGTVAAAGRVDGRSDLWWVRVQPDSDADVTIALPADRACDTQGAVCTADEKVLTNRPELAVPGPQPTLSSDATLSGLALSGVDIGVFDPATTEYTADVGNDVTETTVTATTNGDGATYAVKLDGVADSDGTVPLAEGSNVITVEVTAEDEQTTKTYTVTVTRAEPPASSDATLSGLALGGVDIGTFDSGTTDYTASVGNEVTETTVTATANDGGATYVVKLDGAEDADGTVALAVGDNTVNVLVTAEDGQTTRTYTVTVTRAEAPPSDDATLSGLTLSGVNFGAFNSATTDYTASIANDVDETTVTATANDGGATYAIKLDGVADSDGTVPLAEGSNVITIEVTAEDGNTAKTYTVTVTRAEAPPPASSDATLSGLALSGVDIGTFDSATTEYTASVGNEVTETTVTATANDGGATYVVKLGGVEDADGTVDLAVGANAITIEVTAEDGNTTKTYTVTVTRAAPTAPSASVTVTLSPRPEQYSTGTDITIEWTDSDACGGQYFVGVYDNEELEVVVRVLGYHPAPATTTLSADLGLPWDSISSYDWWVGVICASEWTLVGKASLQSGLPRDS